MEVITEPPGATIYVDGIKVEQGLFQGKSHSIKAEKRG